VLVGFFCESGLSVFFFLIWLVFRFIFLVWVAFWVCLVFSEGFACLWKYRLGLVCSFAFLGDFGGVVKKLFYRYGALCRCHVEPG